jgi:osmotically-inducible protein OsmY
MKQHIVSPMLAIALAACAGSRGGQPPPQEPVSTTTTTSLAMTVPASVAAAHPRAEVQMEDADPATSTRIRKHLANNPALSDVAWEGVRIATVDGHVTIAGVLPTVADACEVERSVREVKGVVAVTNDLHLPESSTQVAR